MKIWIDTEFMEDGATQTVKILSAAFVASNGRSLYVIISDAPRREANDFVREHVLPYVDLPPFEGFVIDPIGPTAMSQETIDGVTWIRCPRADAGKAIEWWVAQQTTSPEFWAWYADYDWVAICQLHGSMMDLPERWPRFCRDLRQEADRFRFPTPDPAWEAYRAANMPTGLPAHHAYPDAHEVRLRDLYYNKFR